MIALTCLNFKQGKKKDFYQILSVGGKFYPQTMGPVVFASLRLNIISVLCSKGFWLEWGVMALV